MIEGRGFGIQIPWFEALPMNSSLDKSFTLVPYKPVFFRYVEEGSRINYLQVLMWALNQMIHGKPLLRALYCQ